MIKEEKSFLLIKPLQETIDIKIGSSSEKKQISKSSSLKIKLNIRKSLDGNLIIYSHEDLDIIIDQKNNKILACSTDQKVNDKVYDSQNRFFKFLVKRGLVDPASVRFGSIYGVLEGKILKPKDSKINQFDLVLINISKWIEKEKPSFLYVRQMHKNRVNDLTDPSEEESTELGEIPHLTQKGSSERNIGVAATNQWKPY